jgi:hypothetical protein
VELLDPQAVIVFGETNVDHFWDYFDCTLEERSWKSCGEQPACYKIDSSEKFGVPVIGLGTNLGNPIGFYKESQHSYGNCVRMVYESYAE